MGGNILFIIITYAVFNVNRAFHLPDESDSLNVPSINVCVMKFLANADEAL